jgi:hypothetical protein
MVKMRVRCVAQLPNDRQAQELGKHYSPGQQVFKVSIGQEYLVYGMTFLSGVPWVELLEDFGYLFSVPLCLFEVTDDRVSRHWRVRSSADGRVSFWPPSFYREYYFDDLIEGVPQVLEDFRNVRALIESEAGSGNDDSVTP